MTHSTKTAYKIAKQHQRDELIRYHCEEISTHLGALKQLTSPKINKSLEAFGKYLKQLYVRAGGIEH